MHEQRRLLLLLYLLLLLRAATSRANQVLTPAMYCSEAIYPLETWELGRELMKEVTSYATRMIIITTSIDTTTRTTTAVAVAYGRQQ